MNYTTGYYYLLKLKDGTEEEVFNDYCYESITKLDYQKAMLKISENIAAYLKARQLKFYDVMDIEIKIHYNK